MNCEFCSSPVHIWFDCPKKPVGWKPARLAKKSTAARKDVPVKQGEALTSTASRPMRATQPAGTQALPVDTISQKPKLGRPPNGFDKLAYNRKYMRDRRARKKESGSV